MVRMGSQAANRVPYWAAWRPPHAAEPCSTAIKMATGPSWRVNVAVIALPSPTSSRPPVPSRATSLQACQLCMPQLHFPGRFTQFLAETGEFPIAAIEQLCL